MPNKLFNNSTERFITFSKDLVHPYKNNPPIHPEKFQEQTKEALRALQLHLQRNTSNIDLINQWPSDLKNQAWGNSFVDLKKHYTVLHAMYEKLTNEEDAIIRIEKRSHRVAVFYRGVTTLVIGAAVMAIYGVAEKLEIAMPLMRITQ